MKVIHFLPLALPVLLLGCAAGNQYGYQTTDIRLPVTGSRPVALSVADHRGDVVSGAKKPNWVGVQRAGFGNPYKVTTLSGQPLADDVASSLKRALQNKGYTVDILPGDDPSPATLTARAKAHGSTRIIQLTLNEWKSDAYMSITVHYDLLLSIYDEAGNLLARNQMAGEDDVGGVKMTDDRNSETVVGAFERRMGYLFQHDDVIKALSD